ncbi:ATP-binding protein [Micromonospora sp. NPDC023814]|uniref:sensor histidine kinase n=1 Tax=Micromonospora sp. NPDC023814 TaxID=3154596 RepID=UPI0033E189B7
MTTAAANRGIDRAVATVALSRAVLLMRGAATAATALATVRLADDLAATARTLGIVVAATVLGVAVLSRWPGAFRHRVLVVVADTVVVAALLVTDGGVAYFSYAAGACALAGVLYGMSGVSIWAAHAALGYTVAVVILRRVAAPVDVAAFVMAFPVVNVLAGLGGAVAMGALTRYVDLMVTTAARAQRSAAASERARLARELHDSVSSTLRGVSFAALALPSSLRRSPDLAEQLAETVSRGAAAAADQARDLIEGLRLDDPTRTLADAVEDYCRRWSARTGTPTRLRLTDAADQPIAVRYELMRILREALENVDRHAEAAGVNVSLGPAQGAGFVMVIQDDGRGFAPAPPSTLLASGHYGLVGMRERALAIGGVLELESAPGRGTTVSVRLPS